MSQCRAALGMAPRAGGCREDLHCPGARRRPRPPARQAPARRTAPADDRQGAWRAREWCKRRLLPRPTRRPDVSWSIDANTAPRPSPADHGVRGLAEIRGTRRGSESDISDLNAADLRRLQGRVDDGLTRRDLCLALNREIRALPGAERRGSCKRCFCGEPHNGRPRPGRSPKGPKGDGQTRRWTFTPPTGGPVRFFAAKRAIGRPTPLDSDRQRR